jgi:ribosomal protein S18 acetylase RimI-like enzyme
MPRKNAPEMPALAPAAPSFASPPGTMPPPEDLQRHAQVIEPAQPADCDAVVALFAEDLKDLRMQADERALRDVFATLVRDPRQVILVARRFPGDPAVGVLVATRIPSVKFQGWSMWIEELFVGRAARQWGLGRRLVEALLALARSEGCKGIDLEAYHGNAPAALLYRAVGFRRLGRERFAYRFAWEQEDDEP